MPKREKSGKEVTVYISNDNLAFLDGLVSEHRFRNRSAALDAALRSARARAKAMKAMEALP